MTEVETYFFTYHGPSASVRGWESGPNQGLGSDRGSTPRNELESTLPGHGGAPPASTKDSTTFKCPACPKSFIQERGLKRHYDEKHRPDLLKPCLGDGEGEVECNFKWTLSRKSEYRNHLKKKHGLKDDKIDKKLGGAARCRRRRDRIIESNLPPHISPPPIERDRQSLAEAQQRPLMPPFLAVGKDALHVSPPLSALTPFVAYHPRLGDAEPEATTTDHEDSSGLEHLSPTHHSPSRSFSEEGIVLPNGHFNIHGATDTIDTALRIPSVHSGGSTADIPPNTWMPVADYCEIGTNTFASLDEYRVDIDQSQALSWDEWGQSYYQSYIA